MPPVGSGLRSRKILVETQEARARDVRRRVLGTPARRIGQIVAAIEHDPVGIVEALREDFCADEGSEDHAPMIIRDIQAWVGPSRGIDQQIQNLRFQSGIDILKVGVHGFGVVAAGVVTIAVCGGVAGAL